jgi:hypothetical protein
MRGKASFLNFAPDEAKDHKIETRGGRYADMACGDCGQKGCLIPVPHTEPDPARVAQ